MKRRALLLATLALAGCAGPSVQDYASESPKLDLRTFLTGDLTAKGFFTDRSGRIVKRFTVAMKGSWAGNQGTLDEQFVYTDGTRQQRVWHLKDLGNGRFTGTASDVVGEADGEVAGNAFRFRYTLALPVDGRVWDVQIDDWMFLMDERTVLNRSPMSKFGIHLGDITIVITRD